MIRRPPRSTRTDTLFPYPTRFRSVSSYWGPAAGPGMAPLCVPVVDCVVPVLLEPLPDVVAASSDGVEHAASSRAAAKVVTREKRIICPLEHIPGFFGFEVDLPPVTRSEERRVGKECVRTGTSGGAPEH